METTEADPKQIGMWLKHIDLKNYRCFHSLHVEFDRNLTVLIARNGAGKTSVLDAVAAAFGTYVGSFHTGKRSGIDNRDVRLLSTNPEINAMEPQYPAGVIASGIVDGKEISWARYLNTPKSGTTIKEAAELTAIGKKLQLAVTEKQAVLLPLVCYYGTGRLWDQKKKTVKKVFASEFYSRTSGFQDCLDPASTYKFFEDWFRYVANADSDIKNRNRERMGMRYVEIETAYTPLIKAVQEAVNTCLAISGWSNLRWSFTQEAIVMEHASYGTLAVGQLSDGVRNMIAMVADIAYRMVRVNPDMGKEAVKKTPALVLIDEVDMHLHPEWQQVVLQRLLEAFPNTQFIVTTHSPQVLTSVKKNHVRVMDQNLDGEDIAPEPTSRTYGRSNAEVMHSIMGVSPTPPFPEKEKLAEYLNLVEQGDWRSNLVNQLRSDLENVLGAEHPTFVRADMVIRRREALEK